MPKMLQYYLTAMRKWNCFSGRARRSEYWYFVLTNALILLLLAAILDPQDLGALFFFVYFLCFQVAGLAVMVRRLHDINKSGWWYLLSFIPFIGGVVLFIFSVLDGDRGPNRYGLDPKTRLSEPS